MSYGKIFLRIISLIFCFIMMIQTNMSQAQTLTYKNILDRADRPTPTHKISYGTHADQVGELWLPKKQSASYPVVVLIHGGCWRADLPGPELVSFLADALRNEGLAVWSITYRRVGTKVSAPSNDQERSFSPYPDTFLDVATAVDKLRELAKPHNLNVNRIVTTGHSAGGHLALWAAARHRLPTDSPLHHPNPLKIHATIGIAALPDLAYARVASAHACGPDTVDLLIDSQARKETAYRDTSVTSLLPIGVSTTLISGTYDGIVAPAYAMRYRESAKTKGEAIELLTLENAGHFELIAPWLPAGREVALRIKQQLQGLPAQSEPQSHVAPTP
jgi:acetyl esterase/lipase